jgi:hypothetical protein
MFGAAREGIGGVGGRRRYRDRDFPEFRNIIKSPDSRFPDGGGRYSEVEQSVTSKPSSEEKGLRYNSSSSLEVKILPLLSMLSKRRDTDALSIANGSEFKGVSSYGSAISSNQSLV